MNRLLTRRTFLRQVGTALALAGPFAPAVRPQEPEPLAGRGDAGSLRDPGSAGRPRAPTTVADNDAAIQQVERQLRCTCGCNLDIFTCRTTDFSCTYSPELHREVVALRDGGKTAQQILDAFVAKYGERALMAPTPAGFNLWGYLLPGATIVTGAAVLAIVIARRGRGQADAASDSAAATKPVVSREAPPSTAELERLERELADVED